MQCRIERNSRMHVLLQSKGNFKIILNPGFLTDPTKIESLVAVAIPDLHRKFQKDLSRIF